MSEGPQDESTPWRQSVGQMRADRDLSRWAGKVEPPPTSPYPAEWTYEEKPLPPPSRPPRRARPAVRYVDPDPVGELPASSVRWNRDERRTGLIAGALVLVFLALVVVGAMNSKDDDSAGSSGTTGATTGTTGARSSGSSIGMAEALSPFGRPIEMTDIGDVPPDHVFTFDGNEDVWDYTNDGWRPTSDLVRVYLDPELTVLAPDAYARASWQVPGQVEVSARSTATLSSVANGRRTTVGVGERWGAAAEYYLAVLADLHTGDPVDTIQVQRFTVQDDRPRPEPTAIVDENGVLRLTWPAVPGATQYEVVTTSLGVQMLGMTVGETWSSDSADTPSSSVQNEALRALRGLHGASADSLAAGSRHGHREVLGIAVVAVLDDGRMSLTPVDSAILGRVPFGVASTAADRERSFDDTAASLLPGSLPYEMADGSTQMLPVSYRADEITGSSRGYDVPYQVWGAEPDSWDPDLTVTAPTLDAARAGVEARNAELDAARDPHSPPQPYVY